MTDNPFPSMSNTEYELFKSMIREEARKGAETAIGDHLQDFCAQHRHRTEALETAIFGRREAGIIGMDEAIDMLKEDIKEVKTYVAWLKVTLTASLLSLVVGLIALILNRTG
jgi:N6-adenosine-specific RNA methylase IME4